MSDPVPLLPRPLRLPALWLGLCLALPACVGPARPPAPAAAPAATPTGVPGVAAEQLDPQFWIARLQAPDAVLADAKAIAAQNARLMREDPSMHRLEALPASLEGARVRGWIEAISRRPRSPRFDAEGRPVDAAVLDGLLADLALDAIPGTQATRFGLVVRRAALRTFPTWRRVFAEPGDHDIDRFQESALFPGTPVAIAHASRDGRWRFVVSPNYAAWIEAEAVAEGTREQVFGYLARAQAGRIVSGARVATVHAPDAPQVSELPLEMGVRLPLLPMPADGQVNGQHAYASWLVELPVRDGDGRLAFAPALVPRAADTAAAPLALTRANLVRQAFKFLGERYGWGHDYNGRDCSGFVAEVHAAMGLLLPRNTGDQAGSPALRRTRLGPEASAEARRAAVDALEVGDLIHVPGHVMMMLGRVDGRPWVIHDINGGSFADVNGEMVSLHLNAVAVTPLEPLRFDRDSSYIDRITTIVHPAPAR